MTPNTSEITLIHPTATKLYPCAACGEPIFPGTRHVKHVYRTRGPDRKLSSLRYHLRCEPVND